MTKYWREKRRFPRLDTTRGDHFRIKVFGVKGKPLEAQIINLSLGGVAFVTHWKSAARTVQRFAHKVEIQLPDGVCVNAITTLQRLEPKESSDECVCVLQLTDINLNNSRELEKYISV